MPDLAQIATLLILVVGGTVLLAQQLFQPAPGTRERTILLGAAAVLALAAVAAYPKFGRFHDGGRHGTHTFHYHDIWHYAIGARYFPELGYERLYDCSAVALDELSDDGVEVPAIQDVRRLADPMTAYRLSDEMIRLRLDCAAAFTPERWDAFKADQKVWLDLGWDPRWWQVMLFDLGFNPPPSWAVFGHGLIRFLPLNATTLELLPFLDIGLLLLVGGVVVWRTWGSFALFGYLLVVGTNYTAHYGWTGGSYFRQVWFAALLFGLAALHEKRWRAAGVLLALTALLRVFPAAFGVGAALAIGGMVWRGEVDRRDAGGFAIAGLATAAVVLLASVILFDPALWVDFFQKIGHHGDTYFVWHIGFKKWATWSDAAAGQDFWWTAGLARFLNWNAMLHETWEHDALRWNALRLGMLAAAGALSLRLPPARAALLFGGTAMFGFTMPANYYYVWLAAIPAVWLDDRASLPALLRLLALFALLALIPIVQWVTPDGLVQNSWWNAGMFWFFCAWIATAAAERTDLRDALGALVGRRWREIGALSGAALALIAVVSRWERHDRPNLVLIVVDALRADRLGVYGYKRATSPHLDAWAARAAVFERAYSHAPWTTPAVASLLTSRLPRDHGVVRWDARLPPEELTLAEHLQAQGYATMATVSHVVFQPELGFDQGFDHYDTSALELGHPEKAISSKRVLDAAIAQLRARPADQPFFLWTHWFDPHNDYVEHPGHTFGAASPGQPLIHQWSDAYDSEVAFVDAHLGELFEELEAQGVMDDTVIALVSDHGEEFGDHGGKFHAVQLYDEVVRVPMIVGAPGLRPSRVKRTVPTSDLAPTLCELLGVPIPDAFDGRAIPHPGGRMALEQHREVVMETVRHADKRGLLRWPWKLIEDRERQKVSLFDLSADPQERTDQAAARPQIRADLQRALQAMASAEPARAPDRPLSAEEVERLRALGYVVPDPAPPPTAAPPR